MLAIHPGQVEVINKAFTPTAAELEWAERVIAAFEENPGAGTIGMDGKMIDRPHLIQAKRIVELARQLIRL
jgi:citrate lyase subunit beta/citryl-CoA lyase